MQYYIQQPANRMNSTKSNRQDLRVLQKNMIYCSGLPSTIAQSELMSQEYFGQYGKVEKLVKNPFPNRNYCSIYITYNHQFQAATAILACNQFQIGRSTLWCLFGTMKYCKFFLKKIECKNLPNCPYLHAFDQKNEIQIQASPSEAFPQHQQLAKNVLKKHTDRIEIIKKLKKIQGFLPEPIYALEAIAQDIGFDIEETARIRDAQNQQNSEKQELGSSQGNSCKSNDQEIKNSEKQGKNQETKRTASLDSRIKKLILKQLERANGSRLLKEILMEEQTLRQVMINGLRK